MDKKKYFQKLDTFSRNKNFFEIESGKESYFYSRVRLLRSIAREIRQFPGETEISYEDDDKSLVDEKLKLSIKNNFLLYSHSAEISKLELEYLKDYLHLFE